MTTLWKQVILDVCMLFPLSLHTMDVWLNRWTQKKNYERLQKALDSVMSIREMTQVQEGDWRERREGPQWIKATLRLDVYRLRLDVKLFVVYIRSIYLHHDCIKGTVMLKLHGWGLCLSKWRLFLISWSSLYGLFTHCGLTALVLHKYHAWNASYDRIWTLAHLIYEN